MTVELRKFVIKPGRCGHGNCREQHSALPLPYGSIWQDTMMYQASHHGTSYVYRTWMVEVQH